MKKKWNKFEYNGNIYELSHLDPFEWFLEWPKEDKRSVRKYQFNILFSMHCFTKRVLASESTDSALLYKGPTEARLFCFERYELSKQLPKIIRNINNKSCWHTQHGSFFTIEIQDKSGIKHDYEIYFDVYKSSKNWLTLMVKSAYIRDAQYAIGQPKKRKVRFSVIARTRFERKELRPPG